MENVFKAFPIDDKEYVELDKEFEKLCKYQSWGLIKKNTNNNHVEDVDDFIQELRIKMLAAGSYHKRQVYIENCIKTAQSYVKDGFLKDMLDQLEDLWHNRKRHGANRQKFGELQEKLLERIVKKVVPKNYRPDKQAKLKIDAKFSTYCKSITWNHQKTMGKKITREKSWRTGLVSLNEFEYLAI